MTGYHGRRGPNVSQYVANLNTIPTAQNILSEPLNIDEDLALFTNSEFIDWDVGDIDLNPSLDFEVPAAQHAPAPTPDLIPMAKDMNGQQHANKPLDFVNGDFSFADYSVYQNPVTEPIPSAPYSHTRGYPIPASYTSPVSTLASPVTPHFDLPTSGKKRKLDLDPHSQQAKDEAVRVSAEEDKRRRNTAASARFRVKKKQREQALERAAKEMTDKVNLLESRITQLEMENNWLKGLITEKNERSAPDISAMYKKFTEDSASERSTSERTDGVGTESTD